jgi:iron complex outermembrane receptor protein
MRFLIGRLLWVFLVCFCSNLFAQINLPAITGKVSNENLQPVEAATVILLNQKDSTVAGSTITGKKGIFQLANLTPGNYFLLIRAVGFVKYYTKPYALSSDQALAAEDIILKADTRQLKEVQVVSSKPEIETRPGKIILNIQNSILADGNSAMDILRQSPGVRVDNANTISVVGKQKALVMIDGKPTNLATEDIATLLKSMQSSTIDRIELITSGSAKYDASGAGIVNIILKKGKNIGFNGSATATAGYGQYYKSNAGLVFNDRTTKFNIFGNYSFANNKIFHNFQETRNINDNDTLSVFKTNYGAIQKSRNNTFNIGTDYFISANHTIGFLISGAILNDNIVKNNNLKVYNQSVPDSSIAANSIVNRNVSQFNYNLNYNGKLDKAGKTLSANFDYNTRTRSSNEYITNTFYSPSGNIYRPDSLLQNLSPSHIRMLISKVDFTDPLSKTSTLEAGVKYSNVRSDNTLIFGPQASDNPLNEPVYNDHFVYTEIINTAYINFEHKTEKFELTAGLRTEQTINTGNTNDANQPTKSNYADLFPSVLLVYKLDEKHNLSLSYNRGITRPNYSSLNPFRTYADLYDYDSGNPNLKPEYSNTIELSYNYNDAITTTLYTNIISNTYEFPFYEQDDATKVMVLQQKNLGTVYNYGVRFFAPVTFTKWWNADFNADASYQRYVAYPVNGNLDKGTQDIILSTNQHFNITKTIIADVSSNYESPTFFGLKQFRANYYTDAGISKQFWNKRGSLRLNATDIFNTDRDRYIVNYQNVNFSFMDKKESQTVRLTFTYKFGKSTVKAAKAHRTGNEDEQKRAAKEL